MIRKRDNGINANVIRTDLVIYLANNGFSGVAIVLKVEEVIRILISILNSPPLGGIS